MIHTRLTNPVDWPRVVLTGAVALVILGFWPGQMWNPFAIAVAALWSLPPEHRTRRNAALIGWSVGCSLVLLWSVQRSLTGEP